MFGSCNQIHALMKKVLFLMLFVSAVFSPVIHAQNPCNLEVSGSVVNILPNGNQGSISVEVIGCDTLNNVLSYVWYYNGLEIESFAELGPEITPMMGAGNYCVAVYCGNDCIEEWCGEVGVDGGDCDLEAELFEDNDGNIGVEVWGGTPPYMYSWSNGATTAIVEYYEEWCVTIIDAEGCTITLCEEETNCFIENAWVDATACEEGLFYVSFGFESGNTSEYFNVYSGSNNYDTFYYAQDFYGLGPFEGNGQTMELLIVDGTNEDCSTEVMFNAPDCNEAGLECNAAFEWNEQNNTVLFYNNSIPEVLPMIYTVQYAWDFGDGNTEQTMAGTVDYVYAQAGVYEACLSMWVMDMMGNVVCESISCQLVTVGEDVDCVDESQIDETMGCFEIWDPVCGCDEVTYANECEAEYYGGVTSWVEGPCVEEGDCEIENLMVELTECEEGAFYVYFGFESSNTSDYFSVYGNGTTYGTFYYGEDFYVLGPFEGEGQNMELVVVDGDSPNSNCSAEVMFVAPDCEEGNDACEIWDVFAEAWECDSSGYFYVDVAFQANNTSNQFQIVGNGANYGTFSYGEPYYTVGPLLGDGSTEYEFVVQDVEYPNCSDWVVLDPINCEGCMLSNLSFQFNMNNNGNVECSEEGYQAIIDFNHQNVSESGFDVFYNGEFHSFHSYDALPLTLDFAAEPAIAEGSNSWLEICNNDDVSCCLVYGYPTPCQEGEVSVANLTKDAIKLYPNPVRDQLLLDYPDTERVESLQLFNALGQSFLLVENPDRTVTLAVPTGYYVVELQWKSGLRTRHSLIKE